MYVMKMMKRKYWSRSSHHVRMLLGNPPGTAIGTKAIFDTVISALKIHMSSRKMSTVAYVLLFNTHTLSLTHQTIEHTQRYTHDEVAKWIMGVKRMDRNGDLIMGFLSRLSGGFTNQRFVSLEKKGNVVVKLNRVDEVAIVCRVFNTTHTHTNTHDNTHSLNEHTHNRYISEHRNTDYKICRHRRSLDMFNLRRICL